MAGDNQIFGLENFGNTCYCNSVIQALYNTRPFREYILSLAPTDRPPRRSTPGSKPHPMLIESRQQQQAQASKPAETGSSLGQRSGLSALKSKFSRSGGPQASSTETVNATSPTATGSGTSFSSSHASFPNTTLQAETPIAYNVGPHVGSMPLVGFLDEHSNAAAGGNNGSMSPVNGSVTAGSPPAGNYAPIVPHSAVNIQGETDSLIDLRKKNALLKGPIVNVDQSFSHEYNRNENLVTALKDLFESISENDSVTGVASPSRLVEILRSENDLFRSSMHQDAQEFFNFLLNRVIEEEDKFTSAHKALPSKISATSLFAGELTNEMRCLFCETVTRRNEPFYDFSLETLPNTSVYHCLQKFSGSEVLGGSNKFYCDVCGGHQEALKRMKVRKAPPILVLHLKRFKFSEDEQRNTKLMHRVLYSKYLRIPVTTDDCNTPEKLYELSSIIVHLGGGPYQGHYVVVSRTPKGWLLYDDEIVDYVDESFVYSFFGDRSSLSTAYLLIYQEVSEIDHETKNVEVKHCR